MWSVYLTQFRVGGKGAFVEVEKFFRDAAHDLQYRRFYQLNHVCWNCFHSIQLSTVQGEHTNFLPPAHFIVVNVFKQYFNQLDDFLLVQLQLYQKLCLPFMSHIATWKSVAPQRLAPGSHWPPSLWGRRRRWCNVCTWNVAGNAGLFV